MSKIYKNCTALSKDYLEEEKLEGKILMKRLKEIDIDSPRGIMDVAELLSNKPLNELMSSKKENNKSKKENLEWVYRTYNKYGNVYVSVKIFNKLDKSRLGNYSLDCSNKTWSGETNGYVIWKL